MGWCHNFLGKPICSKLLDQSKTRHFGRLVLIQPQITHLILCQGILYAIGGGNALTHQPHLNAKPNTISAILYNPCLSYMTEWFVARRGLANGVMSAGTAMGGLVLPLVLPSIIEKHGIPKTLRVMAIVFAAILLPLLPFLRGRLPISKAQAPLSRRGDGSKAWMRHKTFHFLMLMSTIQGLGLSFIFSSFI
jgi:MCP family monocarboxylic acid transporter-like MFS transporter 10